MFAPEILNDISADLWVEWVTLSMILSFLFWVVFLLLSRWTIQRKKRWWYISMLWLILIWA